MLTFPHGSTLLFQGDSITDTGRDKTADGGDDVANRGRPLGSGYAMMVAAHLWADHADWKLDIRNCGISGNRIVDLYARSKEHIWNLAPATLSILIGVNDTWHEFGRRAGVDQERFARMYRMLLADTKARLPGVRFVLCEPFVLPCGVVVAGWREDVDQRRATVRALALEFDAVFVPLQDVFDAALATAPAAHWAADGVHPTPAGHLLMARAWMRAVCG
jgi:lysophospholipase L1-like esterase